MADSYAMYALRRKRAHLAGEIEKAERAIAKQREKLATLDSVILMFSPDCHPDMIPAIRPYLRGTFFDYREVSRMTLDALREVGGPAPTRTLTEWVISRKGLAVDANLRRIVDHSVRTNLARMERRKVVRRIMDQPETWWELAGAD